MNRMKKRVCSLVLAVATLFAYLPVFRVLAAETVCEAEILSAFRYSDGTAAVRINSNVEKDAYVAIATKKPNGELENIESQDVHLTGGIQEFLFCNSDENSVAYLWDKSLKPLSEPMELSFLENCETFYDIYDVIITDDTAVVTLNANRKSNIVLYMLDENTRVPLHTITGMTYNFCEHEQITIPIKFELPEYFIISAVLYDFEGNTLCEPFEVMTYTSKYEDFEALTVDNFDDDVVLNFDEDQNNNFGVLADDVIIIDGTGSHNVLTDSQVVDGSFIYTFSSPDAQLGAITVGDKVYVSGSECLFRADEVVANPDSTITFVYTEDDNDPIVMTDFYSVLKVDMTCDAAPQDEGGIELQSASELTVPINVSSYPFNFKVNDNFSIKGVANATDFSVSVQIVFDGALFGDNYFSCRFSFEGSITNELELNLATDNSESIEKTFNDWAITIPTNVPLLNIYILPSIALRASASGSANFSFKMSFSAAFSYNTDSGFHKAIKKTTDGNIHIKGEAEVDLGPRVECGIKYGLPSKAVEGTSAAFLSELFKAYVGIEGGLRLHGSAESNLHSPLGDDKSYHACNLCVSGELEIYCKIDTSCELNLTGKLKLVLWDETPVDYAMPFNLGNDESSFYLSLINDKDSVFGGKMAFGSGDCPNRKYKTRFTVKDEHGTIIDDKTVTVKHRGKVVAEGIFLTTWLYDGMYQAETVSDSGKTLKKSFTVDGSASDVVIVLSDNLPDEPAEPGRTDATISFTAALTEFFNCNILYYHKTGEYYDWYPYEEIEELLYWEYGPYYLSNTGAAGYTLYITAPGGRQICFGQPGGNAYEEDGIYVNPTLLLSDALLNVPAGEYTYHIELYPGEYYGDYHMEKSGSFTVYEGRMNYINLGNFSGETYYDDTYSGIVIYI